MQTFVFCTIIGGERSNTIPRFQYVFKTRDQSPHWFPIEPASSIQFSKHIHHFQLLNFHKHDLSENPIWWAYNRMHYLPMNQCSEKQLFTDIFDISNCWWWCKAKPLDDFSFLKTLQSVLFCNIWQVIVFANLDLSGSQQNSVQNGLITKRKCFICTWKF